MRLDVLLRDCVRNERQWIDDYRHRTRQENNFGISVPPGCRLDVVAQHNGRDHRLSAAADYSVWYDNFDKTMGTGLVVVAANDEEETF
jgi:hypothetical protein